MRLLQGWTFGSLHQSRNRVALAPMTNQQSFDDGRLSPEELQWLQMRAEGGFGLVLSCAAHVLPEGKGFAGQMGVFSDDLLPGLRQLASVLSATDSLGLVQLYHGGVRSPRRLTGVQAISASDLAAGKEYGEGARAATEEEIEGIIEAFVAAAERCFRAGFAGVELHGAHGYLLCQFIDRHANRRTDQWGGSLENRARLLFEIVRRTRERLPRPFIVGVRLSPDAYEPGQGLFLEDTLAIAERLDQMDIDYLHLSLRDVLRKPVSDPDGERTVIEHFAALPRHYALMVAGGIKRPSEAERALELGADLVALGRIAIGNADWPKHVAHADYQPKLPPYTSAYLQTQGLSSAFINYVRAWPNFVAD